MVITDFLMTYLALPLLSSSIHLLPTYYLPAFLSFLVFQNSTRPCSSCLFYSFLAFFTSAGENEAIICKQVALAGAPTLGQGGHPVVFTSMEPVLRGLRGLGKAVTLSSSISQRNTAERNTQSNEAQE